MHSEPQPLPQHLLDIADKSRSNPFAWRGQFSPQLVEVLIRNYAPPAGLILDPFVGSGTVLYEAARLGFPAFGTEINPAAIAFARVYEFCNVPTAQRSDLLRATEAALSRLVYEDHPLLHHPKSCEAAETPLERLAHAASSAASANRRTLLQALVTMLDVFWNKPGRSLIWAKWKTLRRLVAELPFSTTKIRACVCDARRVPLPDSSADFVLSSPPYINVFNYHQQYRASAEILGADLLQVARSEIGSNRKNRQNRFLTVVQYCLDMAHVLSEMSRVCKDEAQMILIVGRESNVRKTPFFNSDIIETLATDCVGLLCPLRQQRCFTNRFGQRIYEDVLHLVNTKGSNGKTLASPRRIALYALKSALDRAPAESVPDLREAMAAVESIRESPLLGEAAESPAIMV